VKSEISLDTGSCSTLGLIPKEYADLTKPKLEVATKMSLEALMHGQQNARMLRKR